MEQPIKYWSPSIAPSGMTYYDGSLFPEWKNSLFISALVPGDVRRLEISNSKILSEEILFLDLGRVRDIATSPDGSLIVATDGAQGKLVRVIKK
ncbi:MAG: PQQ-dependent sugar dehydrogenase [SAR86 cluster bacterium]|jgi:aldose sugar dehydrogenase|nr:PQQ-dependent sugar dehydrogenase [SAR86 cluster bacterium]